MTLNTTLQLLVLNLATKQLDNPWGNPLHCWSNTYIRRGTATPAHLLCGGDKLR